MAALNYAEVYQKALAQKFHVGVKFAELYDAGGTSTNMFKFVDGKTIKIPRLTVTGMKDTNRDGLVTAARRVDNTWETKELSHDRQWDTLVDPSDIDETNEALTIGNITSVFNNEELYPEMDAYMASKLYADLGTFSGTINNDAVTTGAEVLAVFDKLMTNMDDEGVNEEGRILYVTPAINALLKAAITASRRADTGAEDLTRIVSTIDNVKRVTVPSARMKSAYDFTTGFAAASGAVQINMVLVHPKAVIAPIKVSESYLDEPSAKTNGKYYYFQRQYWDAFILERKVGGVQVNAVAEA
jgi:hypothetical protein